MPQLGNETSRSRNEEIRAPVVVVIAPCYSASAKCRQTDVGRDILESAAHVPPQLAPRHKIEPTIIVIVNPCDHPALQAGRDRVRHIREAAPRVAPNL